MNRASPKLTIAGSQRFACVGCGQCCRRWHVALTERGLAALAALAARGDADFPTTFTTTIHGHPYLAHRPDGDCVFLDAATQRCRLHARFGAEAKPVGCRVYPLNIASTYPGEVSVTARLDCPAVQRNSGPLLTSRAREIEEYVRLLGPRGGFTSELGGLSRAAVERVTGFLRRDLIQAASLPATVRSRALLAASTHLAGLGATFMNDAATLNAALPAIRQRALDQAQTPATRHVGAFARIVFREWLATYLRRDEEILRDGTKARFRRTLALVQILAGRGSLRALGDEHPDVSMRRAGVFPSHAAPANSADSATGAADDLWECYWRMLDARLETLQFCGVCYFGLPFFAGLRALIQTYPLVLAAARCHAAARHAAGLTPEDVQYATGAIDHSWGRSRLLQVRAWRSVEEFFGGARYARLLATLEP